MMAADYATNPVPPPRRREVIVGPHDDPPEGFSPTARMVSGGAGHVWTEDQPPGYEVVGLTPGARRPRIRATTPNPSRTARATASIEESIQKIDALYALAEANDPQPARWRRRARREWRNRWGIT